MFSLLYIDDEPGLLELGKLFLESTGDFEVTTALSAGDGLEQLAQRDFDAIVSDFQMPGMDGIELLKRVRKSFGSIPFVLFTGRGREEVVIEAINNGVDFYLQKGGDPKAQFAELAHKVRQAVTRRRAETALSDSEKRLADIINFLPDATFAIDTHGFVIAWNRAIERMTGVSSDDILGKGNYAFSLPFYHERRPLLINLVLEDDPAIAARYPFVKKEGRTLFSEITIPHFNEGRGAALWFTASPLYNRNGDVAGAIESIREITERKRAEENLVSVNREYTNLLDQIQDVYYFSDIEGRLVRASRSMALLLGYDDISECIGRNFAETFYVNPSDRKRLLEEINRNGKVSGFEVLLKKKDGTPVLIEASSHLSFDPAGKPIGVEGTFRDITERKKAEEELRAAYDQIAANEEELHEQLDELILNQTALKKSEGKFRDLAEASPDMIWEMDTEGVFTYMSPLSAEIIGFTPEEIVGKPVFALVPKEALAPFEEIFSASVRTKKPPKGFDLPLRCRDGHVIITEIRAVVLADSDGRFFGFRGIARDITDKKKAADELQAANEQLVASDEELREQYDDLASSERRIRMSEARLQYMLGFYEYAQKSERELLKYAIEGAGIVTGSPLGYLAFLNEDESELSMYAWSESAMTECSMRDKPIVYKTEKTGLWGEAVRQRCAQITNDYNAPNPAKKGYPAGHPHIYRHMNVPVIEDGHVVLVAGVANKSSDYSDNDVSELTLLMQGLWTFLKQRRVQEELRMVKISVDQAADEVFWMDFEGNILFVNDAACRINGYSRDEFLKMTIYDLNPDLTREIWTGSVTDLRVKKTQLFTTRHRHRDREIIDVEIMSVYVRQDKKEYSFAFVRDITERKRSETVLAESERKYRTLFETANEGIWTVDAEFRTTSANRKMQDMFGFTEQEMMGRPVWDFVPPDEAESMKQDLYLRRTGVPGRYDRRWVRKDGAVIWCFTSATPLFSPDGTFIGSFGMFTDITERRLMEEALHESEAKFRVVLDQSFEFIGLMTPDGLLIEVNRAALALVGISESEVINRPFWETPWWSHSQELQERLKDAIRRAASGETVRFEASHPAADGHLISVDFSVKPVVDNAGRILYLIPEGRDITERKRTEDALFSSQQMLELVLDTIPQRVFWKDRNSVYLGCNMPLARDAGYTNPADLIGKNDFDTASKATADLYRADDQQVMETGQPRLNFEEPQIKPDGSHAWLRTSKVPLRDRWGSVIGVLGTYEDITDLKHAEESLRESEEKYRTLVESSFDGIAIHKDGIVVYVNRTGARLLGSDEPSVFIGKPAIDIIAPAFRELIAQRIREAPESMQELIREQFLRLDGTPIDVDVMTKPSMWEGRPAAYVTFRDITAQLRADEALRESSRKYAELFEMGSEAIFLIDNETGALLETNSAACEMYGYPRDILLTMKNTDLSAEQEETRKVTEETPQGIVRVPLRYHRRRDGTVFPVEIIGRFFVWNGRPVHIAAIRDITEHKRAEEALRESEEKYRMLVEQSRDGVFIIQDGRLIFYNGALAGLTGYTAEDLDGRLLSDLIAPEDRELVLSRARDRAEGRRVPDLYEISLLHKDGTGRTRVRVRAGLGSFRGRPASIGTFYDITEDRRREEALRENEEKYRTLVEVNRDIIYSLSIEGIILYVSPQTITVLGYRPDELEGRNFSELVHPDDVEELVRHIQEHLDAGKPVRSDQFRVRRKDGTYRWFEDKTIYATDPRGKKIIAGTIRDITEEKAAQDSLRESEEKFRALVESTSDFIWEADTEGRYTYVSPQVRRILGYEPEELLGKTPFEIMPPGEADKIVVAFRQCIDAQLPIVALENKALRKDGSVVILETSGVVRTTNNGSFLGYRGIDRDITKRKQAEEALRESEARLSSILHGSPVLQFVIDRNHRVISWNNALEEYSGIKAAAIIGTDQQWRAFYPEKRPVLADLLVEGNADAIDEWYIGKFKKSRYIEGAYEATDFFPHMGSSGIWLSFTAAPIRDDRGTILGAVETLEDVTDRVNAETALRESEERTRTILNTAQAGIVLVDAETHEIVDANKKALELIGLDRESVIGLVCHHFICPAEKGKCPVTDCGQTVDTSERVLITAAGTQIAVLKTVVSASIGGRNVLVESFVDISEQKRSEAAIREANRKLNLLNSITRHDIRNQLMVAQGYTQLAGLSKPDAAVSDFLAKISIAIENIQRQIEFTKTYQELGVHAPGWFPVTEIIRLVRPENVALHNTCKAVEIYADPMIDNVFFNLFDNAVKYGERVTTITVGCKQKDSGLVITFADNGVGIPAGEKMKIFEKGYGKNTGLGLFLVREILAITGITINETGTYGEGAVFEIIIPKGAYRITSSR